RWRGALPTRRRPISPMPPSPNCSPGRSPSRQRNNPAGLLKAIGTTREFLSMSPAERRHKRLGQQAFWARQAENTLDRATAMMPKLLYDRLDELGLDFVVVYPTAGLRLPRIQDDAARRAVIRAY